MDEQGTCPQHHLREGMPEGRGHLILLSAAPLALSSCRKQPLQATCVMEHVVFWFIFGGAAVAFVVAGRGGGPASFFAAEICISLVLTRASVLKKKWGENLPTSSSKLHCHSKKLQFLEYVPCIHNTVQLLLFLPVASQNTWIKGEGCSTVGGKKCERTAPGIFSPCYTSGHSSESKIQKCCQHLQTK